MQIRKKAGVKQALNQRRLKQHNNPVLPRNHSAPVKRKIDKADVANSRTLKYHAVRFVDSDWTQLAAEMEIKGHYIIV